MSFDVKMFAMKFLQSIKVHRYHILHKDGVKDIINRTLITVTHVAILAGTNATKGETGTDCYVYE